jgi:CheY-like chemotaxis protein
VTILVVDDKAENRYLLEAMLRGAGYAVVSAENGVEALHALGKQHIDLIVSDILMPQMDGFRLCREVKSDEKLKPIPFVFYTATYTDTKDEELGLSLGASRFLIKPLDPDIFLTHIKEVAAMGEAKAPEASKASDPPDFPTAYSARLVKKLERKVEQLEATSRELKRTIEEKEDEVRQRQNAEKALSEALHYKDQFVALLGHELRNPLAPICNAAHALKQKVSPDGLQLISLIERQVQHLSRLVNDLLDVSAMMRGKMVQNKDPLDLALLLKQLVQDQQAGFVAAQIRLEMDIPETPVWVSGDAVRLSQLFRNLLDNAMKFTPCSGWVRVTLATEQGMALITVKDSGIGIKPELIPHLFSPFLHLQPRHEPGKGGLGLGLALVKGIVDFHGGSVKAESEGAGRGTSFMVGLPTIPAPARVARDEVVSACEAIPRRVLIIEDNEDAALTLRMLFEAVGHEVRTAENGCYGLETARSFRPDVIFCDIGLPGGMDGYSVARAIRSDPTLKSTFLIAITGFGEAKDQQLSQEAGFNQHVTKPGSPETMLALLNEIPVLHSDSVS